MEWQSNTIVSFSITNRGFTGHEHMQQFGLINMNGRMYDPILARMLSPDPLVTNSALSQDYNRYAYVRNNPMKFTNPSGYQYMIDGLIQQLNSRQVKDLYSLFLTNFDV